MSSENQQTSKLDFAQLAVFFAIQAYMFIGFCSALGFYMFVLADFFLSYEPIWSIIFSSDYSRCILSPI